MTYENKCLQCDNEFESLKPAKFCSAKCRVTASRSVTAEPKSVTADVTAEIPDIFETLEKIRVKYNGKLTKEILSKGTGLNYTFMPSWLRNHLTLRDIQTLKNF